MENKMNRYYSPSGKRRKQIEQSILDAIALDPNKDPCKTIEASFRQSMGRPVTPQEHLDNALPLVEMVLQRKITYTPKEGWKNPLNDSTPAPK